MSHYDVTVIIPQPINAAYFYAAPDPTVDLYSYWPPRWNNQNYPEKPAKLLTNINLSVRQSNRLNMFEKISLEIGLLLQFHLQYK